MTTRLPWFTSDEHRVLLSGEASASQEPEYRTEIVRVAGRQGKDIRMITGETESRGIAVTRDGGG